MEAGAKTGTLKRTIAVALVLAFVAACGDGDTTDTTASSDTTAPAADTTTTEVSSATTVQGVEGLVIGQVIWGADRYQLAHAAAVEAYAEELGLSVQTIDGQQDATVQANAIEDLIAAGVDGIMFQPFDPAGAVTPIEAAQEAGVPLVTWAIKPDAAVTTPFLELNEYDTTFEAGVNAVNAVKDLFPGDPIRVVALDIPTVALCSELRIQGFVDGVLSADPTAEIVARPDGEGNRLASTTVMEDQIQRDPDFNIVTACNGEMLFGALTALEAVGRGVAVDKVPQSEYAFVIADGVTEVEAFLNPASPIMQVAVLAPKTNGRLFMDMMLKFIQGEIPQDHLESTGSLLLPTDADCDQINEMLVEQYGEGVDC